MCGPVAFPGAAGLSRYRGYSPGTVNPNAHSAAGHPEILTPAGIPASAIDIPYSDLITYRRTQLHSARTHAPGGGARALPDTAMPDPNSFDASMAAASGAGSEPPADLGGGV